MITDELKSLYIDVYRKSNIPRVDDFIIAVSKLKSNSVYHVAEIKSVVPRKEGRVQRYYMRVFKTDLLTAINRDPDQKIITIMWYPRGKKK